MSARRRHRRPRYAPVIGIGVLVLGLMTALVWSLRSFLHSAAQKPPHVIQTVQVIRLPPPPPEAPPPPPPEEVQEQVQQQEPEPSPDAPSPGEQLGLDADGAAGGDAFGLAARKGGSDLVGTGGAAFAWYTNKLKDEITEWLSNDSRMRSKKFTVALRIWIEPDGRVKEVRLTSTTGDRALDQVISSSLATMARLNEGPPLELPQPIALRIVSHT
jgi:protein TonB